MEQEARMTQLYDKMAAEQAKFRDWLAAQPPEEILNHAYEYVVREDILMCMEEAELQPEQAEALLASVSPLSDVYQVFSKKETSYMDIVRESIETEADARLFAQRETPLYQHSASYAREHGELEQYRTSHKANIACKEAIEAAIRDNFDGMHLNADAVRRALAAYGPERTVFVLASTVQTKDWDGRFSPANKEWPAGSRYRIPRNGGAAMLWRATPPYWTALSRKSERSWSRAREQPARTGGKSSIRAQLAANLAQSHRGPAPEAKDKGALVNALCPRTQ